MKRILLTLTLLAGAAAMTACATSPEMTTVMDSPAPSASSMPTAQAMPDPTMLVPEITDIGGGDMTNGMDAQPTNMPASTGVTSMDKARSVIEAIEDELERLSEVDDAQVVIAGNKAAVALEFDDQYLGGIDDRLRGIVKERIDSVISGITTVAITADATLMDALDALGERLETMSDMTALESDLDAIISKINAEA